MLAEIEYRFHPVGQGLFCSGWYRYRQVKHRPLRWVFDCGTTSAQTLVSSAIDELEKEAGDSPCLDLVAISHFDKDHISGIVALLKKFPVDTLLVPYVPLWQRLVFAYEEGISLRSPLMKFFTNPVAYIRSRRGVNIRRIVLVPSSKGEQVAENAPEAVAPQTDNSVLRLTLLDEDLYADPEYTLLCREAGDGVLLPGSVIHAMGEFEFVPYNDLDLCPTPYKDFHYRTSVYREELLKSPCTRCLDDLKEFYDRTFGRSSKKRNVISLFLYAGPVQTRTRHHPFEFVRKSKEDGQSVVIWEPCEKTGVLYTGDGYLDTQDRLNSLETCLTPSRLGNLLCVQVMHHGATTNWHEGVASRLSPGVSVFCSDPEHAKFGHPHGPVVRDFLPYCPIQVDKVCGMKVGVET